MKNRKAAAKIGCLICSIFLLQSNGRGESTLQSVKKGGEGIRTWAVLYFDEGPVWAGVSQPEENKLTLFFAGNAGELNGSITSLNPANDRRIVINQLSDNPAIFGADVICNGNIPLVILKNEGHIVIALNDLSLLNEKLTEITQDLTITPCRLIDVTPDIQDDQMMTSIRFDGNYEWKGYIRPSNKSAALLIEGAQLGDRGDQYPFEGGPLQSVRFISDSNKPYEMKVLLFFNMFSRFTIARKPQSLFIQTPYTGVQTSPQIVQAEITAPVASVDQQKNDVELLPIVNDDEAVLKNMVDEMIQGSTEQKKEEPPIKQEIRNVSGTRAELEEWGGISDQMASIVGEFEKEELGSDISSVPEEQEQKTAIETSPVVEEEASAIPWDQEVSFRFQETPIKDVLRLIATSNNINIVIGEDVKGSVTMNLEGVTLKQALEKVIYMHNCEYIVDEDIIIVKSMDVKYKGGMITKVYHLKYADAKNIAVVVRRIVTNDTLVQVFYPEFLVFQNEEKISQYETQGSSGGMGGAMGGGTGTVMEAGMNRMMNNPEAIQGIRRSSILVVTDRPDKIREVDKVIQELDKVPVQFIIESRLVELRPSYNKDLGIDWDGALGLLWNKETVSDYTPGLHIAEGDNFGIEWELKTGKLSPVQYFALLDFLKEKTDSQLKMNPRILAMNNEESSISVGTTVPIPTIQTGGVGNYDKIEIEYKEINIQLNVAPHLGENGEITMYVNPVVEEISDWVDVGDSRVPVTTKQSVNSIVTVKDGETVVIGGLIKNQKYQLTKKIWLLGDLPLLGKLFQHDTFEDTQTELMIFITPKIVEME